MQCPLMKFSCCCLSPKFFLMALGAAGLVLGVLSAFRPRRSIALYQWIMERFNWKVVPLDESREVRNTARLGALLGFLSLGLLGIAFLKY